VTGDKVSGIAIGKKPTIINFHVSNNVTEFSYSRPIAYNASDMFVPPKLQHPTSVIKPFGDIKCVEIKALSQGSI
jgi:hypothetical protein